MVSLFCPCYVQTKQETYYRGSESYDPQEVDVADMRTARRVTGRSLLLLCPFGQPRSREEEAHDNQGDLSDERPVA